MNKSVVSDYSGVSRVSAIIPAFNSSPYIQVAIESLLNQSVPCSEIIVIDDASSDQTREIVLNIARSSVVPVEVHRLAENSGPSLSRNIGMQLAREDWVLLMDHDDIADDMLIKKLWSKLMELEADSPGGCVLVHSGYREISEDGSDSDRIHCWRQVARNETQGYLFLRNPIISCSGVLLKRKIALELGGFNPALRYSQDWDLWLRLAQVGSFGYVDAPLVRIRRHATNLSRKAGDCQSDERTILSHYDIALIKAAIYSRSLSWETNTVDFASILYRLERWDEGFELVESVIAKRQDLPSAYFWAGLYHLRKKDLSMARDAFERAMGLSPQNGAALNNLAIVLALYGEYAKAAQILRRVLLLFPNYLDARHNLEYLETQSEFNLLSFKVTLRELRPVLLTYAATD